MTTEPRRRRATFPYGFVPTELKTIWADFNVGTDKEDLMRLTTRGSVDSLRTTGAQPGEKVLLTDHDVWVIALLVKQEGIMYARFDWELIEDVKGDNPNEKL